MANYDSGILYDSGVLYDAVVSPPPTPRKKMAKVRLNLAGLNPQLTLQLANNIKTSMTGNASFATPIPTLASITTLITTAQTKVDAYETSRDALTMKLTERDDAMVALKAALAQLASYVDAASAGDEAKIQSAGMGVRASSVAAGVPDQVSNLAITAGDEQGELDAQWDPVTKTRTYEVQTSPDPFTANSWVNRPSVTKSFTKITGLTSGSKIWMRVRSTGVGGLGPWSDPATKIVP